MAEVTMPRLSDTMSEGTVGRWLKKVGEAVAVGEIIAEIETDKATMELESFDAGTMQKIVIPEGQTVPIGEVIAYVGEGALPAEATPAAAPAVGASQSARPAPAASAPATNGVDDGRVKASPLAKRIADELGVDLRQVAGSGPGGRIVKEDVEAAAAGKPRPALALREQIVASGTRVSVNDLVVKASAKALRAVPAVNVSYAAGPDGQPAIASHPAVNVSVAVALPDGLVAPVVRDADKKSVGTISAEIRDMATRARDGKIKPNELDGATFQVTNLGMFGVVEFGSIITAPQAASLAVGAVRKVPVVRGDQIVIGQVMNVTISADHRVVDGAVAAEYLKELKKLLEAPMSILI
ncbi:2-oxo acid dehydrogenase subunit E2 [Oscillochloris sp. ZM17-4]|uniref:dihydrolipoamide acetyltransferase family protein n=1 Tax=Oscillochloris sp. ZM17-4 TaxID=2866714 RepID=UPI001C73D227|nr:dihydrolipoamide acetyltransferase family protein [Oscillochloris sp. ZM17-4]MBX0326258.1 2-oxo acid dehydrogenase subunit E2 [Oscillochloris sp. ZM17-4]